MTDTTWPPPWTLKPTEDNPHLVQEYDEDDKPLPEFIHWSLAWGFALNAGYLGNETGTLAFDAHFSDADQARGMVRRSVTPEQLEEFARLLLNIAAAHKRREAGR